MSPTYIKSCLHVKLNSRSVINLDTRLIELLSPDELYLLLILTDMANKGRDCWPQTSTLLKRTGWSKSTLQRVKASLQTKEIIAIDHRRKPNNPLQFDSNRYTIKTDLIQKFNGTPRSKNEPTPRVKFEPTPIPNSESTPAKIEPTLGSELDREVLVTEVLERKVLVNTKGELVLVEDLPFKSDAFLNAWMEWKRYKKDIRSNLTPLSIKKQLQLLAEASEGDAIEIIETSIRNGWKGLFELKKAGSKNGMRVNSNRQHAISLAEDFARRHGIEKFNQF